MKLYYSQLSNYCAKVKFLIDYKKINIKLVAPPGGYGSKIFKKIAPLGTIPTLKNKKNIISESEVINEYLNELYPKPKMLSKDIEINSKIRLISKFHDTKLEPSIRYFFQFMKKLNYKNKYIKNGFLKLEDNLNILEKLLNNTKFAASDKISLADCPFPSFLALLNIFKDKFNGNIKLGIKSKKYFSTIKNDNFMSNQYNEYYEIALNWSKEKKT